MSLSRFNKCYFILMTTQSHLAFFCSTTLRTFHRYPLDPFIFRVRLHVLLKIIELFIRKLFFKRIKVYKAITNHLIRNAIFHCISNILYFKLILFFSLFFFFFLVSDLDGELNVRCLAWLHSTDTSEIIALFTSFSNIWIINTLLLGFS